MEEEQPWPKIIVIREKPVNIIKQALVLFVVLILFGMFMIYFMQNTTHYYNSHRSTYKTGTFKH
jgi:hypothetical protein